MSDIKKYKKYSAEEVAKHNTKNSLWLIISGEVIDVTKFVDDHPGGIDPIVSFAGKDATSGFVGNHSKNAEKLKNDLKIGVIKKK